MKDPIKITDQYWSENTQPVVSIFNWVYNHKDFIRDSIESILMQKTTFPVEIIIHDDASNDGTREIILEYQMKYPQLFNNILHTENQWSKGKSVMTPLCEKTKGKYIALAHGDDYWTDTYKLQKQFDLLEVNTEFVMTFHDAKYVDEKNNILQPSIMLVNDKRDFSSIELTRVNGMIPTVSMCYRNVLKNYPECLKLAQNGDAVLTSLLGHYGGAKFMNEISPAGYRQHSGGTWSVLENKKRYLSSRNTYQLLAKYYHSNKELFDHFILHANAYDKLILQSSIEEGDRKNTIKFYLKYFNNKNINKNRKELLMYFKATIKILFGLKP
jgi:glycosyltransferase involved in cell wall biosynthesis